MTLAHAETTSETRWEDYAPWEIVEHLLATHHPFTWAELDRLGTLATDLAASHGPTASALRDVADLLGALRADLEPHMLREERVLFPFAERMRIADAEGTSIEPAPFGTVRNPIRVMHADHDAALEILHRLREVTRDHSDPLDGCASCRALYAGLRALDADLREHIRLEDEILFPMLIEREREMVRR